MGSEFDPEATEFRRDWGGYRFIITFRCALILTQAVLQADVPQIYRLVG